MNGDFKAESFTDSPGTHSGAFFGSFVLSILKLNNLSYPVILHFDAFRGVDFIGDMTDFRGIWASGLFITIINAWLGETLFQRERFLSYLFLSANVLIALLILIITGVVIGAN
ncbi:MAG: hypothetical protein AAB920_02925 [Patescibacteria group bacterium]